MNELIKTEQVPAALVKSCERALAKCERTMRIWTRSRSGMMLRNMTVGAHPAPLRQMRQVAAELQRKQAAMVEAKYKVLKRRKKAEIKRQEAAKEKNILKREYLLIEAEEAEATARMVEQPYLGAMREVVELGCIHDSLKASIQKKYGRLDEEVFEIEEAEYWVRRIFAQSLWDIRATGRIGAGNQEVLEQIGLNPAVIQKMLLEFLEATADETHPSSEPIEHFLSTCADKFKCAAVDRVRRMGLPTEIESGHLFAEEDTNPSDQS